MTWTRSGPAGRPDRRRALPWARTVEQLASGRDVPDASDRNRRARCRGPCRPAAAVAAIEETVAGWAAEWAARPRLRGWQHALAILPAAAGAATLAARATNRRERVAAVAWGAGIVGMLTASASYHRLPRSERTAKVLRRLDHAAIWGAVAGTWTPIALAVLPGRAGTVMAGTMWGAGVTAAVAKTAMFDTHRPPGERALRRDGMGGGRRAAPGRAPAGAHRHRLPGGRRHRLHRGRHRLRHEAARTWCPASTATTSCGTRPRSPAPASTRSR